MTIVCTIAVDLSATSTASVQTTLNLPLLSSQPCILVLAILPAMVGLGVLLFLRRLSAELEGRGSRPSSRAEPECVLRHARAERPASPATRGRSTLPGGWTQRLRRHIAAAAATPAVTAMDRAGARRIESHDHGS